MFYQRPLSNVYMQMPAEEVLRRIGERKEQLGRDLCILGHHYQCDEVFQFADLTGDSLKLSRQAAETAAKYIVFCGVHFMAESADILTPADRAVILPDLSAGCGMADMADVDDVVECFEAVADAADGAKVVPVTYVNSTAAIKAATGAAGGACCTSSNARRVFEWALKSKSDGGAGADKVVCIPDQHLGRNTAVAMGYGLGDCAVYDPARPGGGLEAEDIRRATFLLWKGHCYVHQKFTVEQIEAVRAATAGITVMVHPECPYEVVQASDRSGSTEQILRAVTDADAGTSWAIGTEANMVRRLAADNPDKHVRVLSDTPSVCVTMARIDPPHLLWVLDRLAAGEVVNRIRVAPAVAEQARVALDRMIAI